MGYSLWGHKEPDMSEWTQTSYLQRQLEEWIIALSFVEIKVSNIKLESVFKDSEQTVHLTNVHLEKGQALKVKNVNLAIKLGTQVTFMATYLSVHILAGMLSL